MLHNYFKIILRNFLTDRMYTAIIVLGLAIGIAASLMIAQYVQFELSFDKEHKDIQQIHYAYQVFELENATIEVPCSPAVGPLVERVLPEIETFARIVPAGPTDETELVLRSEKGLEKRFIRQDGLFCADASVFELFSISMISGDSRSALIDPNSVVLTQPVAEKLFPGEDPLNKVLTMQLNKRNLEFYRVTGIVKEPAPNSSLQFKALFSFEGRKQRAKRSGGGDLDENWNHPIYQTFVKLRSGSVPATIVSKINAAAAEPLKNMKERSGVTRSIRLLPFADFHFFRLQWTSEALGIRFSGDRRIVYLFAILAGLILAISWVNYINLTTARSLRRAKEVGLRKVHGASRKNLVMQFLVEFGFLNLVSLLLALTLAQLMFPVFTMAIGSKANWILWREPTYWIIMLAFLILSTIISGIYPAWVMSNYRPATVLKGTFSRATTGGMLRKGLVLAQFGLSVVMIMGIYMIDRQLNFLQGKDIGMSIDQVVVIRMNDLDTAIDRRRAFEQWKAKVQSMTAVKYTSTTWIFPGYQGQNGQFFHLTSDEEAKKLTFRTNVTTREYLNTMDIMLLHGRDFLEGDSADVDKVIINRTAAMEMGFKDPQSAVGELVTLIRNQVRYEIIGVVNDFSNSAKSQQWGEVFFKGNFVNPQIQNENILINLDVSDLRLAMHQIEEAWEQLFPGALFDYFFLDDHFSKLYNEEQQFAGVFAFFSVLGIVIACLGLFGLSSYNTGMRTKEVGIRKSLGASVAGIVWLFSRDYVRLVFMASVLGIPVGAWLLNEWLKNYPNRISIGADTIIVPLVLMVCIAFSTVGFQTLRAARANPVEALKYE